jgi:hypothetical protein
MSAGTTSSDLAERLLAGEKRALARAISLVENDDPRGWALVREVYPHTGKAAVVEEVLRKPDPVAEQGAPRERARGVDR